MSNVLYAEPEVRLRSGKDALEREVLDVIDEEAVISLDGLVSRLPRYSWNQIFHTVDRLARTRRIVLRRHRFDYTLFATHYAA